MHSKRGRCCTRTLFREMSHPIRREHTPAHLLHACTSQGFALRAFESQKPSLHDVFIHLVGAQQETVQ